MQDVCKIVETYCHRLKAKVRTLSEKSDHGSTTKMVEGCLASRKNKQVLQIEKKCQILVLSSSIAVRCGERPGIPAVRRGAASRQAKMGGAMGAHPTRHRRKSIPQHAAGASAANSGRPRTRDPLRFGHAEQ